MDFSYKEKEYRLHTGSMYNSENTIFQDGREALFGLYIKMPSNPESSIAENYVYNLLGEYADMSELLESTVKRFLNHLLKCDPKFTIMRADFGSHIVPAGRK